MSRNIRALRLESGITQSELASRCGFKKQYISRLESSPQNINLEVLEKLSIALGQPINRLVSSKGMAERPVKGISSQIAGIINMLQIIQAKIGTEEGK